MCLPLTLERLDECKKIADSNAYGDQTSELRVFELERYAIMLPYQYLVQEDQIYCKEFFCSCPSRHEVSVNERGSKTPSRCKDV